MSKPLRFKSTEEFAKHFGLSEIEVLLANEKLRVVKKLKKTRMNQKLTQAQLAKKVGTKQPAIARMESGEIAEISFDFLLKVALTLDVGFTIRPPKKVA